MKDLLKILFALIYIQTSFAQDCKSYLKIQTNRDSALIFLNNELTGYGKIRKEVNVGKYFVTIKQNILRWDEHEINDTIDVKLCDKEYLISYNLFDKIYIDSKPQDASIVIYDSILTRTPNFVNVNEFQTVTITKNGFTKSIYSKYLLPYNNISLEIPHVRKNEIFSESDWFKVLVGTATIFGAASAYFKIKADNINDEYQKTREPAKLNEVKRLDLYSGIAFGLLQVNFGYLIYKFLIE